MKTFMRIKMPVFFFVLISAVAITGAAEGGWMFSQGNVANVQWPASCTYAAHFGWGLDLEQKSGTFNWVHMTVPSPGTPYGARYLIIRFYTGSADAYVSEVHVYDGEKKVKEFKGLKISNGWKDKKFDLGSKLSFKRGMSVSIRIAAGVESMSHRFIFSGAGANFY